MFFLTGYFLKNPGGTGKIKKKGCFTTLEPTHVIAFTYCKKSSMANSLPVENLLPQDVRLIIN